MLAEQIRIEEVITANGGIGSGLPLDDWQDLPLPRLDLLAERAAATFYVAVSSKTKVRPLWS